jgi:hypothetical protein
VPSGAALAQEAVVLLDDLPHHLGRHLSRWREGSNVTPLAAALRQRPRSIESFKF